jgi:hypothetical protein
VLVEHEALALVRRFRCLTPALLNEFTRDPAHGTMAARERGTRRLLQRLRTKGLVTATRRLVGGPAGGSSCVIYQLSAAGARLIGSVDRGGGGGTGASAFVEHRLMVAEIALAFLRSARTHRDHSFATWESEGEAAALIGGDPVPDGRLLYASADWELSAFVEADLGTERPIRFADKMGRYLHAFRHGEWRSRLGAWPALLTICPDVGRATTLRRATEDRFANEGDVAMECLFASLPDLTRVGHRTGPLAAIWQIAGEAGLHRLVDAAETEGEKC